MTVALKRKSGDLIWIDAVISFNRQRSASVTKHPIETGAFISDHTIVENPIFTVSGVISDVDFNNQRPVISESDKLAKGWRTKEFENNVPIPDEIVMISSDNNVFKKYLPESVSQFFPEQAAGVEVGEAFRPKTVESIEKDLIHILSAKEEVSLVEFEGNRIKEVWTSCIMTGLTFEENPESGDALWPTMTFEKVVYAISVEATIPTKVSSELKNKAAATNGKGNQSPTKAESNQPNPRTNPTNNSSKNARDISAAALTNEVNN